MFDSFMSGSGWFNPSEGGQLAGFLSELTDEYNEDLVSHPLSHENPSSSHDENPVGCLVELDVAASE